MLSKTILGGQPLLLNGGQRDVYKQNQSGRGGGLCFRTVKSVGLNSLEPRVGRVRTRVYAQLQLPPSPSQNRVDHQHQLSPPFQPPPPSPSHNSTQNQQKALALFPNITTIPQLWPLLAQQYGDNLALDDPHAPIPAQYTFNQLATVINQLSAGFQKLGLSNGETVSLISENSSRWLIADQAIQSVGAADAVRGISSTVEELKFVIENSCSSGIVVQDSATLDKLLPALLLEDQEGEGSSRLLKDAIKWVVVLWGTPSKETVEKLSFSSSNGQHCQKKVLTFDEALQLGKDALLLESSSSTTSSTGSTAPTSTMPTTNGTTTTTTTTTTATDNTDNENNKVATLVYTSGTTGHPKGVKLTHTNLLYQVNTFNAFLTVNPTDKTLSLLPPWHIYERTCELFILASGGTQVYTKLTKFKDDLSTVKPHHFVCVPLVLDTLYSKVMTTLKKASFVRKTLALSLLAAATVYVKAQRVLNGVSLKYALKPPSWLQLFQAWMTVKILKPFHWLCSKLVAAKVKTTVGISKTVVSGGGSLPPHLDDFFESIGIEVLNGWGLTEASPVLACRSAQYLPTSNVRGSVGKTIPGTVIKIVDPETKSIEVPDGTQGLILAKGPGVMTEGYAQNPAAAAAAFVSGSGSGDGGDGNSDDNSSSSGGGWYDTGDLGWRAPLDVHRSNMGGCIVLTGRAKDTLVLLNGENVEPQPIEDDITTSPFIKFAMLVGAGHRNVGALVVPAMDTIPEEILEDRQAIEQLMKSEVVAATARRVRWEQVHAVCVVKEPFSVENGCLTRTMKLRRQVIVKEYAKEVEALEHRLR